MKEQERLGIEPTENKIIHNRQLKKTLAENGRK